MSFAIHYTLSSNNSGRMQEKKRRCIDGMRGRIQMTVGGIAGGKLYELMG